MPWVSDPLVHVVGFSPVAVYCPGEASLNVAESLSVPMPAPLWFLSRGLVNLPGYGQDFNAEEAIWGWAREDAMGNLCLGSREALPEKVGSFLSGLAIRTRRSETTLPDGSAIKVRGTPARLQARFPAAGQMHIPSWVWFSVQ